MAQYSFFSTYVLRNVPLRTCVIVMAMVIFFKLVFTCPCTTPEETLLHYCLYLCLQICIQFFVVIPIDNRLLKICRCYVCKCCVGGQRRCCKCGAVPRVVTVFLLKVVDRKDGIGMIWKHLLHVFYTVYFAVDSCYVYRQGVQIARKDLPTPEEAKILRKYDSESRVSDIYSVLLIFCTVCNVSIIECLLLNYCNLLFVIKGHIVFI